MNLVSTVNSSHVSQSEFRFDVNIIVNSNKMCPSEVKKTLRVVVFLFNNIYLKKKKTFLLLNNFAKKKIMHDNDPLVVYHFS